MYKRQICDGEKITLRVESIFVAEWQTVPPVVNQNYLEVSKPGQYSVKLTDSKGCTAIQIVNVTPGITPVSYTHLDVYKRQVEIPNGFGWLQV